MTERWYLGLDVNATAIAATLLGSPDGELYPLHWLSLNSGEKSYPALPTLARIIPKNAKGGATTPPLIVGAEAATMAQKEGIFLERFKPLMQLAIPYLSPSLRQWQPYVWSNGGKLVSLYWVQRALQGLLATLTPVGSRLLYRIETPNLTGNLLSEALLTLDGVIVSCPAGWGDTYRFNLREAILGAKLVKHPGQIYFMEEAIAAFLGWDEDMKPGKTLILHGGAATTELGLVTVNNLPAKLHYEDFALASLAYGSNDFDRDLFYQLLYPQWQPQQSFLKDLVLNCPIPGEPDRPHRDRTDLQLGKFPAGRELVETARRVRLILQKREHLSAQLGAQEWTVDRQDLEEKIMAPFINQLNNLVNRLLSEKGIIAREVDRILFSGSPLITLFPFLQRWLFQKFPQARLQVVPEGEQVNLLSRGLARLPLFPGVLDRLGQQYSDYFLLWELLQTFPKEAVTLETVLHLLEHRGINSHACADRILALLQGHFPPGFIPDSETPWLAESAWETTEYRSITQASLFSLDREGNFHPNAQLGENLREYLGAILAGSQQKLEEPLSVNLGIKLN